MKILLSLMAVNKDFVNNNEIKPDGISVEFYRYHYKRGNYDRHILLRTHQPDNMHKASALNQYLKQEFDFVNLEVCEIFLNDISDINQIRAGVENILLEHKDDKIDIFYQPGTSLMQLVWYLLHESLKLKTHLIQTIRKEHWKNPEKPELKEIVIEKSPQAYILSLLEKQRQKEQPTVAHITKTLQAIYDKANKVAMTDKVVTLILGASGTGKELIAHHIHSHSSRAKNPYQAINCAAMGDSLLESRLFGHKKGAFTGADRDAKGILLEAKGGTVFLDEIGDISTHMQVLLLRFLQNQEFLPVGDTKIQKTNVRIIAATNKNLLKMCKQGSFRWDLYYRLNVAVLTMPAYEFYSFDERKEFINYFITKKQQELFKVAPMVFSPEAFKILLKYPFPGNFRELENLIEQRYVFTEGEVQVDELPERLLEQNFDSDLSIKSLEKRHIEKVLKIFNNNLTQTFTALGLGSINTLKSKMKEYGI
jgi:transcriptional regulator with PAS, ATPase and Fis domain